MKSNIEKIKARSDQRLFSRKASGSILAESVAMLVVIVGVAVLLLVLSVCIGSAVFYRVRLAHISQQVALYAARHASDSGLELAGKSLAQAMLREIGINQEPNLKINRFKTQDQEALEVELKIATLPVAGAGILPDQITVIEKGAALVLAPPGGDGVPVTPTALLVYQDDEIFTESIGPDSKDVHINDPQAEYSGTGGFLFGVLPKADGGPPDDLRSLPIIHVNTFPRGGGDG